MMPMISWENYWKPHTVLLKLLPWVSSLTMGSFFLGYSAVAQSIVQDDTTTLLNGGTNCSGSCLITGGTLQDTSLFHSFQRFNVDKDATVTFEDPGVANIIGQITAIDPDKRSTINGTLAVDGSANLFLINPNGIIFGENAALDVSGDFIASTAESVVFDSAVINSGDPTVVPLLTLSTPIGLQLGANSGDIVVNTPTGSGGFARLGGLHGQTLAFVGRNVELTPGAEIQVFDILGPSGGAIQLTATEAITMTGGTVENGLVGDGDGSNRIILDAPTVSLTGGTQVILGSFGSGELGQIDVSADTLIIDNTDSPRDDFIGIVSVFGSTASGGDINIQTDNIRLINGGSIFSRTLGSGNSGNVTIQNTETIEVAGFSENGPSNIAATTSITRDRNTGSIISVDTGSSGQIVIDTARLIVMEGGQIVSGTQTTGDAGSVSINATESVTLEGNTEDGRSGLFANALFQAGSGGNVTVNTPYLSLRDGATINVSNSPSSPTSLVPSGTGAAGSIQVQGAEVILLDSQSLLTADSVDGGGANIDLEADAIVLKNGSLITTSATGNATGGNINLDTGALIAIGNSDITANAMNSFGGKISVDAGGVFGAEFRDILTPDNDITAFSEQGAEFSGQVVLITPEIDPTQGAISLPQALGNSETIQAVCGEQVDNAFVASGRGGVPQDARQLLRGETVWQDFRWGDDITKSISDDQSSTNVAPNTEAIAQSTTLLEAQDWSMNERGQVELISGVLNNGTEPSSLACMGQ